MGRIPTHPGDTLGYAIRKIEEKYAKLKWLYILNPNNEVFDECPKCKKYGCISAINEEKLIEFRCKNCGERFFINKKDAISI